MLLVVPGLSIEQYTPNEKEKNEGFAEGNLY